MIVPEDFLKLAENLFGFGDEEVIYRTAISRCYYYAFHFVRENCGMHSDAFFKYDHEDHKEVIDFFRRVGRRDLASMIRSFRDKRNNADYELTLNISREQAIEFINDVKSFVVEVKNSGLIT